VWGEVFDGAASVICVAGDKLFFSAAGGKFTVQSRAFLDDHTDGRGCVFYYGVGGYGCAEVESLDLRGVIPCQEFFYSGPDRLKEVFSVNWSLDRLDDPAVFDDDTVDVAATHIKAYNQSYSSLPGRLCETPSIGSL